MGAARSLRQLLNVMEQGTRLAVREKIGYSLGDCGANFVFQTQLMFLMSFYTDVLGIAPGTAGLIFLVSRLFDAVNDPLMGALADRTSTKWGKYRPWVLVTSVPFAAALVLAFTVPSLDERMRVYWAFGTYNLLMIIYTMNNVPYSALTGVITGDPDERTSLVSWRFLLAMTAGFLVGTFTPTLVDAFGGRGAFEGDGGDPGRGFQFTMIVWAVLMIGCFLGTFFTTRERVQTKPQQQGSIFGDLSDLFTSRTWLALAAATVCVFIYLSMRGSATPYYFNEYVQQREAIGWGWLAIKPIGWFNGGGLLASMVGILLSKPLALRYGKRVIYILSLTLSGLLTTAFYWVPADAVWTIIGLQVVTWFFYGVGIPLLWAMMADVADHTEWTRGRRATAMTFAATLFALKVGASLGPAIQGAVLESAGYDSEATVQSEAALESIRRLISLYPALTFAGAVAALFFYTIGRKEELQMCEELQARHAADPGAL